MTIPKILIVDDAQDSRLVLVHGLRGEPYQILEAEDGRSALERAVLELPDIIVLDVVMPRLNGLATLRLLKSNPRISHIPVLMATGMSMHSQFANYLNAGAADCISKPIHGSELRDKIHRLLAQMTSQAPTPAS